MTSSGEFPSGDEARALRAALERGDWRRLLDPASDSLLVLALMERPAAWCTIVQACARAITEEATQRTSMPLLRWAVRLTTVLRLPPGSTTALLAAIPRSAPLAMTVAFVSRGTDAERAAEALGRARSGVARCRARAGAAPDLEAALQALERWPAL